MKQLHVASPIQPCLSQWSPPLCENRFRQCYQSLLSSNMLTMATFEYNTCLILRDPPTTHLLQEVVFPKEPRSPIANTIPLMPESRNIQLASLEWSFAQLTSLVHLCDRFPLLVSSFLALLFIPPSYNDIASEAARFATDSAPCSTAANVAKGNWPGIWRMLR